MASVGSSLARIRSSTASAVPAHVPRHPSTCSMDSAPSVHSTVQCSSVQRQWPKGAAPTAVCRSPFLGIAATLRPKKGRDSRVDSLPRGRGPATWQRRHVEAVLENSSGKGGSMFEDFDENDKDFVNASLLSASECHSLQA